MSYCRWSSDDFKCDLYVYKNFRNVFVIMVANNRIDGYVPKIPHYNAPPEEFAEALRIRSLFLEGATHHPIGLPCDGMTFELGDLESLKAKIIELGEMGYIYPAHLLEIIQEEIDEEEES